MASGIISGNHENSLVLKGNEDIFLTEGSLDEKLKNHVLLFSRQNFKYIDFQQTYYTINFSGTATWNTPNASCIINTELDYIQGIYVRAQIGKADAGAGKICSFSPNLGYSMFNRVELRAGMVQLDLFEMDWMHIYAEFFVPYDKRYGFNDLIGQANDTIIPWTDVDTGTPKIVTTATAEHYAIRRQGPQIIQQQHAAQDLIIPLPFQCIWDESWAYPYIMAGRSTLELKLSVRPMSDVFTYDAISTAPTLSLSVVLAGCNLDPTIRDQFVKIEATMIGMQIQQQTFSMTSAETDKTFTLTFRNPVAVIFPLFRTIDNETAVGASGLPPQWNDYTDNAASAAASPIEELYLYLGTQSARYQIPRKVFASLMPWEHAPRTPMPGFNSIWFCTKWDPVQPRGSLNFSRYQNASIRIIKSLAEDGHVILVGLSYTVFHFVAGTVQKEFM